MKISNDLQSYREKLQAPIVGRLVAALIIVGMLWTLWSDASRFRPLPPSLDTTTFYHPPAQQNINTLISNHIMGTSPGSLNDLPLASLGVTLMGIFMNPNGQSSTLISFNNDQTKTYVVGDALAPNVVIEKILPNSLVVKHNGQLEQLQMLIQPITFSNTLPTPLWTNHS